MQQVLSVVTLAATLLSGSMDVAMPDKDIDGTVFLVNREHMISEDYAPDVRKVNATGMSQSMRDDAATALEEMFAAAKADGVGLSVVSGYRSYSKQSAIYARKLAKTNLETANSLVALPGASEHQLSLAMDLAQKGGSQLNSGFGKTEAGIWTAANCWRFGFILRYGEAWTDITGYAFEPWHVRYIGKEHAQAVHEADVPLETYLSAHRLEVFDFLITQTNEVLP